MTAIDWPEVLYQSSLWIQATAVGLGIMGVIGYVVGGRER